MPTALRRAMSTLVLAAGAGSAWPVAQQQVFRTSVETVPIYATVLDQHGEMVLGLDRDDFEILDNGIRQELTIFEAGQQPITAMLLVDTSATMTPVLGRAIAAAESFLIRLGPGDRARIGSFSDKIDLSRDFTDDRDALLRSVREELTFGNPTRLWDAMDSAMSELAPMVGRRVIMLLTDGNDTASQARQEDILSRASADDLLIFAAQFRPRVNPRIELPLSPTPSQFFTSDSRRRTSPTRVLSALTSQTGGSHFTLRDTDDLNATFTQVIRELHYQYVLGFSPSESDGERHEITVRVRRQGTTVRARRSYVAPTAAGRR